MAFRQPVRVKQTSTTTGVGTLTLIAASSQFQSFNAVFGAGPVKAFYAISGASYFEVGIGTFTNSGGTLSRDTVLASSNGGSLVSLPVATHDVFAWSAASWPSQVVTGASTLALADLFGAIIYTGAAATVGLPAIANIPAGVAFPVMNIGTGLLTLDPNASETFAGGATTLTLQPGESAWVFLREGSEWEAITSRLMAHGRNAQTGASYTYLSSDRSKHVTRANAGAMTDTLPQAGASFPDGWFVFVENLGPGRLTITPTTSTINLASTLVLQQGQWAFITDDGTNYRALLGSAESVQADWPIGYISGLTLARASATTFTVAPGACANEDGGTQYDMALASTFTKSLSTWAAGSGNGGLDSGAIAANTWYHVHLIRKDVDQSIDVLLSTSPTAPTSMPSGYTARRRLGSILTNGSSQIVAFSQFGDQFLWGAAVVDLDAANPGSAAVSRTLSTPLGVKVLADISVGGWSQTSLAGGIVVSSLDVSDQAAQLGTTAALSGFSSTSASGSGSQWEFSSMLVRTNTSSQIRTRCSTGGVNDRIGIITRGWIDSRGK